MEIVFVSSLDAVEEDRIASVILATAGALLQDSSIAYTLRIRTSSLKLYQQSHVGSGPTDRSVRALDITRSSNDEIPLTTES